MKSLVLIAGEGVGKVIYWIFNEPEPIQMVLQELAALLYLLLRLISPVIFMNGVQTIIGCA